MNAKFHIFAGALVALLLSSQSRAVSTGKGIIFGRLTDARTCGPVAYGNVIIANTTIGAMTLWDGTYCLCNVPPGEQTIRVLCMTWQPVDSTVTVSAGDSLRVDFTLRSKWPDTVPRKPSFQAPRCPEHSTRMKFVLVADVAGPALRLGQKWTSAYAWPYLNRQRDTKVMWGPSCPKCVAAQNDNSSQKRWKGLAHRYPTSWKNYVMPGMADFMAPRGLADSVVVDSCTRAGRWTGSDLRVEIRRVPSLYIFEANSPPPRVDYVVFESIGQCRASISVTEKKDYCLLRASLESTTSAIDSIEIVVVSSGTNAGKIARTILGTMLFPDPD